MVVVNLGAALVMSCLLAGSARPSSQAGGQVGPKLPPAPVVAGSEDELVTGYRGHFASRFFHGSDRDLAAAVSDQDAALVARSLLAGGNANARATVADQRGMTMLQVAICYVWGPASLRLLLDAGADVAARDAAGNSALGLACANCPEQDFSSVTLLLRSGADVNAAGARGLTPLMVAALYSGSKQLCQALLDAGADVTATDDLGWTALMHVTRRRREFPAITQLLLAAGAPVQSRHQGGGTALLSAAYHGHARDAALLLAAGADVNATDSAGWTPLLAAAFNGNDQLVQLLLDGGADRQARDGLGRSARQLARLSSNDTVLRLLTSAGAR